MKNDNKPRIIEQATEEYIRCTNIAWEGILKKHDLDTDTLNMLIEKYATEETCKPVNEWLDAVDNFNSKIGNKFKVDIYHNDVDVEAEYR